MKNFFKLLVVGLMMSGAMNALVTIENNVAGKNTYVINLANNIGVYIEKKMQVTTKGICVKAGKYENGCTYPNLVDNATYYLCIKAILTDGYKKYLLVLTDDKGNVVPPAK